MVWYNKNMENYHSKLQQRYTVKLRVLEKELPYFCTQFFNAKANVLEKQSQYAYAMDFKIFFYFIRDYFSELNDIQIRDIKPEIFNKLSTHDLDAYLNYIELYEFEGDHRHNGETGKSRKLSSIRSLCKYLVKEHIINMNPAELVEMPKLHKKDIVVLNEEEKKRLLETIKYRLGMSEAQAKLNSHCYLRDYAIMMLFLGTGMRVSELVGLNINDINFKKNTARVIRKGGNTQHVYFSKQVANALKQYLYGTGTGSRSSLVEDETEQALFISLKRNRLTARGVQKLIEKYSNITFSDDPELKLHPHLFRKTYGTNLYLRTNDIKLVADQLGHSAISTTERHYVTTTEEHKKLAAIDVISEED